MVIAPLLTLGALAAATPPAAEQSILPLEGYVLQDRLHLLPLQDSYNLILEQIALPSVFQVEESGGFSDVDPAKFSVYGDSWAWNRWHLEGVDYTDAFDAGAAAVHVPFVLLERLELEMSERPGLGRAQGLSLTLARRPVGPVAKVSTGAFQMGGKWPLAGPIMDLISGKHSDDRTAPPPEARRRFTDTYELSVADGLDLGGAHLQLGLQTQQGRRRYLDFQTSGRLADTYDEPFSILSFAAHLVDEGRPRAAWLVLERRARGNAFAELYHARAETATMEQGSLLLGGRWGVFRAGLVLQSRALDPVDRGATRELLDPDGESLFPFFVAGTHRAASLDLSAQGDVLYGRSTLRLVGVSPDRARWRTPVTLSGAPYGAWDFESRATFQSYGDIRLGAREGLELGRVRLEADLYGFATYAANKSGTNGLGLFDVGVKVALTPSRASSLSPFLSFARTPVGLTPDLARLLDPLYMQSSLRLADGRLLETRGGAAVRLDGPLSPTDVYSASTGFAWRLAERWRLDVLGILKAYRDTMRLDLDGDEAEFGRRGADGYFFFDDGPTRYRLVNEADEVPVSFGLHLQLDWRAEDDSFFTVGFSAFNAVGRSPFGNGPGANDVGVVSFDGANPNSRVDDLANLDSDRGFALKAALGYRIWSGLWGLATVRFRDGTPFSFFDRAVEDGQLQSRYHSKRGSPLDLQRPLDGPREDFHLNLDVGLRWQGRLLDAPMSAYVLCTNLLDMGNEIQEVSNDDGIGGRAALEQQIPRAVFFGLSLGQR